MDRGENVLINVGGRPVIDDPARADADDAVGICQRQLDMVNVQKDRDAHVLVDMHEVLHDLFGRDRVKRRDRLVGKDDLRVLRERARERHALLLAA